MSIAVITRSLLVFRQREYMINALPIAKIISRIIFPNKKEAPAFPHRHDVLPESDEDNEEEEDPEAPQRMRTHIRRGDGHLYRDQTFFNGVAFKDRVLDYALRTRCNIRQYRYDKDKLGFECAGLGENDEACGWKIYASILPKDKIWRVRLFVDNHTCEVNGECEMVKVPVIARLFVNKIREEPAYYMPMKIEELIMANWSISVSRPQCQAGRNKALKWIKSEHDQQFARLKDYAAEIVESNPGSSVEVLSQTVAR
uniref:Transposase MuDR plant domain-containing protein n=1 Tax=Brassica oleracea var. oleracea TaxID=109376 RepID=A0A0D3E1U4_BRAOL